MRVRTLVAPTVALLLLLLAATASAAVTRFSSSSADARRASARDPERFRYDGPLDADGFMAGPATDHRAADPSHVFSIVDFGAVAGNTTIEAARANGKALYDAWQAAHNVANKSARNPGIVVVPTTPNNAAFTFVPHAIIDGVDNVVMSLDGVLSCFSGSLDLWPNRTASDPPMLTEDREREFGGPQYVLNAIDIRNSQNVTLTGAGTIKGNGEHWWFDTLITGTRNNNRPQLVWVQSCIGFSMIGWTLTDSPRYHVFTEDLFFGYFEGVTIFVDVVLFQNVVDARLQRHAGLPANWRSGGPQAFRDVGEWVLPGMLGLVALNTDGIDIAGQNVRVTGCTIQNYDDSVCSKPMNRRGNLTQCTSHLLFDNHVVHYGVGASVGSVSPSDAVNCIADTTYRNIAFTEPVKSIYVKPNPGTHGRGVIDAITYENIYSVGAMMWTIWVSTQQQHQPGKGTDTGCSFLYPLPGTHCPLQPRVPVTNLHLRNITGVDAALSPGVLRCSDEGPCTGWVWENVNMTSHSDWPVGADFLCNGLVNKSWTNVATQCTEQVPTLAESAATVSAEFAHRFFTRLFAWRNRV